MEGTAKLKYQVGDSCTYANMSNGLFLDKVLCPRKASSYKTVP